MTMPWENEENLRGCCHSCYRAFPQFSAFYAHEGVCMGQSLNLISAPLILMLLCMDIGPDFKCTYKATLSSQAAQLRCKPLWLIFTQYVSGHKGSELQGSIARYPFFFKNSSPVHVSLNFKQFYSPCVNLEGV